MTSAAYAATVRGSHTRIARVGVYSRSGVLLTDDLRWTAGEVVERWETGARSSLTLEVPVSQADYIAAGYEVRPLSGASLGTGAPEVHALGCFPIEDYQLPVDAPAGSISLSLGDRWKWVADQQFQRPRQSQPGMLVRDQIAELILETGRFSSVTVTATSSERMTSQTWTGSRHDVIVQLCTAIGAEAFIGRDGVPVVRNRPTPGASTFTLASGTDGTRISWDVAIATSQAVNSVLFYSTWPDPATPYFEAKATITDPFHPAHPQKIGPRAVAITDPNVGTAAGSKAAAQKYLSRMSAVARQHTLTCLPDVARQPAQTITLAGGPLGDELVQIQQVTHPLSVDRPQQIDTVNTRSDEDAGL